MNEIILAIVTALIQLLLELIKNPDGFKNLIKLSERFDVKNDPTNKTAN